MVTGLGKHKIILGLSWLQEMNPITDWSKGTLEWRQAKNLVMIVEEEDEEKHLNSTQNLLDNDKLSLLVSFITGEPDNGTWINAKMTTATEIQADLNLKKKKFPWRNKFQWSSMSF